jgi:hypothetical protein
MIAGVGSIDDCGVPRAGETDKVLSHKVMAPFTPDTLPLALSFGRIRRAGVPAT